MEKPKVCGCTMPGCKSKAVFKLRKNAKAASLCRPHTRQELDYNRSLNLPVKVERIQ
jgi:hypothetical protein